MTYLGGSLDLAASRTAPERPAPARPAHVLVVGNEKGGSGKSTMSMHLIVGFLRAGLRVASIDLDARQGSLTRYLENRAETAQGDGLDLPMPDHRVGKETAEDLIHTLPASLDRLAPGHDVIVVDTPGRVDPLSKAAHIEADTVLTPVGESYLDVDLIGRPMPRRKAGARPGPYAEFIWEVRKEKAARGLPPLDWFVCRNRRHVPETRSGRDIEKMLVALAPRFAFRLLDGFSDRTIFKELFPRGLTLLDLREAKTGITLSISNVAARTEIRRLVDTLMPAGRSAADAEGLPCPPLAPAGNSVGADG